MMYNARTNREINPVVMPAGWEDKGKYGMFSIYPGSKELSGIKAKLHIYSGKVYQKEIICFLLSNYIAHEKGLECEAAAMDILKYGKMYSPKYRESDIHYTIGSIPRPFYSFIQNSLPDLPIKKASHLVYFALSAFYYAPDRIVKRMCERIESLKHPYKPKVADRYVILQTMIPEKNLKNIQMYARNTGMTVNELMRLILKQLCMSKKERTEDYHPIRHVFNLYRIMVQEKDVFKSGELVSLYVFISNEHDKKYLRKFLSRRKITRGEILRKAVRTLEYVIGNTGRFAKKVHYKQDEMDKEVDEMDYVYSRMERMDFYRSIYR